MTVGKFMFSNVADMKEALKDYLRQGSSNVLFEKADGTSRQMVCTLHPEMIAQNKPETVPLDQVMQNDTETAPKREHKESPDVIPVWDLEKHAWRSIRLDRIKTLDDMDVQLCQQ